MSDNNTIDVDDLPPQIKSEESFSKSEFSGTLFDESSPIIPFENLKEEAIKHAIQVTNGNIVNAARKLQIGRATLYRLMEKYKINFNKNN